ncbi:hypothetical protein [Pseudokineococcus sp. 1T1Z-3]|uniref:hypothetical protein n=1 Tax=Pseudokineococcus sp. 1T1Z-3 TaxID=3132745 RepID=UPI0030A6E29E
MSTNEVYQSTTTVLVRRLFAALAALALLGGTVFILLEPTNYSGWAAVTFASVALVLVLRRRQQTTDGQLLRRTHLRAKD